MNDMQDPLSLTQREPAIDETKAKLAALQRDWRETIAGKGRRRWEGTPEARAKLVAEWALAQLEYEEISRDKLGQIGNRTMKYAPLYNLMVATRHALARHGIITVQDISTSETRAGLHTLVTEVTGHGASCISELDFTPARLVEEDAPRTDRDSNQVTNLKEYGKQTTYLRRYAYQCKHVLDATEDADEAPGQAPQPRQETRRQPETPQGRQTGKPAQAPRSEPEGTNRTVQRTEVPVAPVTQLAGRAPRQAPPADEQPPPPDDRDAPPPVRPVEDMRPSAGTNRREQIVPPADPKPAQATVPDDIAGMDQHALLTALRQAFVELGLNKIQANEMSVRVTGKPLAENSREQSEAFLVNLRLRIAQKGGAS